MKNGIDGREMDGWLLIQARDQLMHQANTCIWVDGTFNHVKLRWLGIL